MLTELSRRDWPRFFDRVAAAPPRARRRCMAGLDGAAQGEWVALESLSYDADQGELRIALGSGTLVRRDFVVLRHPLRIVGASA